MVSRSSHMTKNDPQPVQGREDPDMAATTTLAPPPVCHDVTHVAIEDDASPVVRLLGRTLRDAARCGHAEEELSATGVVAVRSHDTPQAATIVFGAGTVSVTGGVLVEPGATLVVDLNARFAPAQDPTGDTDLAGAVLRALNPPLPTWRDAAARFWELTRSISGIPDVLVVEADGP